MRTRRRILVTLALTLGVILTAGLPAQAAFGDSVTATTAPITAVTVPGVGSLTATAPCTAETTTWTTTTRKSATGVVLSSTSSPRTVTYNDKIKAPVTANDTVVESQYRDADGSTTTVTRTTVIRTSVSGKATWKAVSPRGFAGYTLIVPGPDPFTAHVGSATRYDYGPVWLDRNYESIPVTVVTTTTYGWTASAVVSVSTCR
ncbi:hypothetical protein ACI79C_16385 [Geodermatophilus sp. SYSU D00697]